MGFEGVKGEGGVEGGDGGLVILEARARAGGGFLFVPEDTFRSTKREEAASDDGESLDEIFSERGCIGKLGKFGVDGIAGTWGIKGCHPAGVMVDVVIVSRDVTTHGVQFELPEGA